jgi:trans-aconitate methyltransferase
VYATKAAEEFSWFQAEPVTSLRFVDKMGLPSDAHIVDVGGGDSRFVDALLLRGFSAVTVLDVSHVALERSKRRLEPFPADVSWIEADVTGDWGVQPVSLWHDRAVFHFLTECDDRLRYISKMRSTVLPLGNVLMATFAPDGPARCSGLPVMRYSAADLATDLGSDFTLIEAMIEDHRTPGGAAQSFSYVWLRRK